VRSQISFINCRIGTIAGKPAGIPGDEVVWLMQLTILNRCLKVGRCDVRPDIPLSVNTSRTMAFSDAAFFAQTLTGSQSAALYAPAVRN
jgi:hypothetical protein